MPLRGFNRSCKVTDLLLSLTSLEVVLGKHLQALINQSVINTSQLIRSKELPLAQIPSSFHHPWDGHKWGQQLCVLVRCKGKVWGRYTKGMVRRLQLLQGWGQLRAGFCGCKLQTHRLTAGPVETGMLLF